jgi:hypothetical protein
MYVIHIHVLYTVTCGVECRMENMNVFLSTRNVLIYLIYLLIIFILPGYKFVHTCINTCMMYVHVCMYVCMYAYVSDSDAPPNTKICMHIYAYNI